MQGKAGKAEDKWEARVKEYENRLRIAGEKIKTEKQGGKERAMQLESQVRYVLFSLESHFDCPLLLLSAHLIVVFESMVSKGKGTVADTSSELERQVDLAKRRNAKAEGIVATASHLLPDN